MKAAKVLIGFAVAMTSLWLGSYALWEVGRDHWASFPTFISTFLGVIGGSFYAIVSATEEDLYGSGS